MTTLNETYVNSLKINRLTKTQLNNATELSPSEAYWEDPEFTGNKLLMTDSSGNIVETNQTIPTVNDATITITQGGVTKGSFTLNQSSGDTIALDAGGGSSLPTQTGHSGEFLTTDGTDASWSAISQVPSQSGQSGKFLTTNGTSASWVSVPSDSSKADKDFSNIDNTGDVASSALNTAGIRTVVETYQNGADWYRLWSDGWCEQGGGFATSSSWTTTNVVLLKQYANTNYSVSTLASSTSRDYSTCINNKTTTGFTTYVLNENGYASWYACGYTT